MTKMLRVIVTALFAAVISFRKDLNTVLQLDQHADLENLEDSKASGSIGLWIAIKPMLDTEAKTYHVAQQLQEKKLGWLAGWGADMAISNFVGNDTFANGLSDTIIPRLKGTLQEKGVDATILYPRDGPNTADGTLTRFLVRIDGIIINAFMENYVAMVRDGIIAQLTVAMDGTRTLADQLGDYGVPNAEVTAEKVGDRGLTLTIKARKGAILDLAIAKKVGLAEPSVGSNWLSSFARTVGVSATKSASIADTMGAQIKEVMGKQLLGNGIHCEIDFQADDLNGQDNSNGNKIIAVRITVTITGIESTDFIASQGVVVRDAIVEQLAGDDESSLEFQLNENHFPAKAFFVKCGWQGNIGVNGVPTPPLRDDAIKKDFRAKVMGCYDCGDNPDGSSATPICDVHWSEEQR